MKALMVPIAVLGSAALHVLAAGVIGNLDWRSAEPLPPAELTVRLSAPPAAVTAGPLAEVVREAEPMPAASVLAPAMAVSATNAVAAPAAVELARPELAAATPVLPAYAGLAARLPAPLPLPLAVANRGARPILPIASARLPVPATEGSRLQGSPEPAPALVPARIGTSAPTQVSEGVRLADYRSQVMALFAAAKTYPRAARERGEVGVVRLAVAIAADGEVVDVAVLEGSGFRRLDHAATSMVSRCSPLPAPPESMRLEFSVLYELSK